jgi:hypothetical protein
VCLPDFYLIKTEEIKLCQKKIGLMPIITPIINPKVLLLEFTEVWPGFFKNISAATQVSIESLKTSDFTANFESAGERSFHIIINYSMEVNLVDKSLLTLSLNPIEEGDDNKMYTLDKKILEVKLEVFHPCETNKTWSKGFI